MAWNNKYIHFGGGDYIYDIECYPNFFFFGLVSIDGTKRLKYEISGWKNDYSALIKLLLGMRERKMRLSGFNNKGYDYNVVHELKDSIIPNMSGLRIAQLLKLKSDSIIDADWEDRWSHQVWESEHIVPQVDLMLVHHFDNKNRRTSLKDLEFNLQMPNLQELPYPPDMTLTREQADRVIDYCMDDDLETTRRFYLKSQESIDARNKLSQFYKRNMMCYSNSKLGADIMVGVLEEHLGKNICYKRVNNKRIARQTVREEVDFNEIILPFIKFKRPEFQGVLKFMKGIVYDPTYGEDLTLAQRKKAGPMSHISMEEHDYLLPYAAPKSMNTSTKKRWRDAVKTDPVDRMVSLNCVFEGVVYDFGLGGIHAALSETIIRPKEGERTQEYDVAGYYPTLGIKHKFYPEHLTEGFCDAWKVVVDGKNNAKSKFEKGRFKLAANTVFGMGNAQHGPFRDLKFFLSITINGQLLLCKMAEMLMDIPTCNVFQVNTDGVAFTISKDHWDEAEAARKEWEALTSLVMECTEYEAVWSRNVNNYIAKKTDGKLKMKGSSYAYEGLDWNQDFSNRISKKAAVKFLTEGKCITEFIHEETDHFKFFIKAKVDRSCRIVGARDVLDSIPRRVGDEKITKPVRGRRLQKPDAPVWSELSEPVPVTPQGVPDLYRSLPLVSRLIIEEIGYEAFDDLHVGKVATGEIEVKNTIKSFEPVATELGLARSKAKLAKAGYEVYLACKERGLDVFPDTSVRREHQRITRYVVSHDDTGENLFKVMPPVWEGGPLRYSSIEAGWAVAEYNRVPEDFDLSVINYGYYIKEARKLVEPFGYQFDELTEEEMDKRKLVSTVRKGLEKIHEVVDNRRPAPKQDEPVKPVSRKAETPVSRRRRRKPVVRSATKED